MANFKCDNYKATNQYYNQLTLMGKMHLTGRKEVSHTNNIRFLTNHSFYNYGSSFVECSIPNL